MDGWDWIGLDWMDGYPILLWHQEHRSRAMLKISCFLEASQSESITFDTWEWIILNTFRWQMIYYIMSDGTPEEVLAKIFRVFDVNRWIQKQTMFLIWICNSHNLGNYLLILYDTLSVENSSTPFASSSKNKKIEYVKVDSTFSPADVSF